MPVPTRTMGDTWGHSVWGMKGSVCLVHKVCGPTGTCAHMTHVPSSTATHNHPSFHHVLFAFTQGLPKDTQGRLP